MSKKITMCILWIVFLSIINVEKVYCKDMMRTKEINETVSFLVLDSGFPFFEVVDVYSQYKEFYNWDAAGNVQLKKRIVYSYGEVTGEYHKPTMSTVMPVYYKNGKEERSFKWNNVQAFFPTNYGLCCRENESVVTYRQSDTTNLKSTWRVKLECSGATAPTKVVSKDMSLKIYK